MATKVRALASPNTSKANSRSESIAFVAAMPLFAMRMVWMGVAPPWASTYSRMRARACCDAGSIGRFLRSIIAVMLDVRWRPEDFIVMVVVFCFQALRSRSCAVSLLLALQRRPQARGLFCASHAKPAGAVTRAGASCSCKALD